jgi:amino-acid N-acetyltransferase
MNIEEITNQNDLGQAVDLLREFDLAYTDLDKPNVRLFKFSESGKLVGLGGLEIYGNQALLRSVAVSKEFQCKKYGRFICNWLENWATENQLSELYLLTTTAPGFFAHLGYMIIPRDEFPENLRQTAQFSELCPASSVCMMKLIEAI